MIAGHGNHGKELDQIAVYEIKFHRYLTNLFVWKVFVWKGI